MWVAVWDSLLQDSWQQDGRLKQIIDPDDRRFAFIEVRICALTESYVPRSFSKKYDLAHLKRWSPILMR
jgi:hypothetical protein